MTIIMLILYLGLKGLILFITQNILMFDLCTFFCSSESGLSPSNLSKQNCIITLSNNYLTVEESSQNCCEANHVLFKDIFTNGKIIF